LLGVSSAPLQSQPSVSLAQAAGSIRPWSKRAGAARPFPPGLYLWTYLRDVLTKLSRGWPQSRLGELVPAAWLAARATEG